MQCSRKDSWTPIQKTRDVKLKRQNENMEKILLKLNLISVQKKRGKQVKNMKESKQKQEEITQVS